MRNKAANLKLSDIREGMVFSFEKTVEPSDVTDFARLTTDFNPLHVDPAYSQQTKFKKPVVHGMLAAGYFSALIGMHCPGQRSLYLSQTASFREPVYPQDRLTVRGTVVQKSESISVITIKTEILRGDRVVIDGEAKVKVMEMEDE